MECIQDSPWHQSVSLWTPRNRNRLPDRRSIPRLHVLYTASRTRCHLCCLELKKTDWKRFEEGDKTEFLSYPWGIYLGLSVQHPDTWRYYGSSWDRTPSFSHRTKRWLWWPSSYRVWYLKQNTDWENVSTAAALTGETVSCVLGVSYSSCVGYDGNRGQQSQIKHYIVDDKWQNSPYKK